MTMLSKDQLLQKFPRTYREVAVPEFGGSVTIRGLTTSERSRFESSLQTKGKSDPKKTRLVREKLIVLSVVDEQKQPMFSDADVPAISEWPAAGAERIFNAIQELSGFSDSDVEDMEKNSPATTDDAETSD